MSNAGFPYSIGIGRTDITPPAGITMVGYKPRVSTSVGHGLEAGALYCTDGSTSWLLIVADLIGVRLRQTNDLRERIHTRTGISESAITIAGTHTHSGPPTMFVETDDVTDSDRKYLSDLWQILEDLAVRTVEEASPGSFESTLFAAPDFGSNRRVQRPNGAWENEWQDPDGNHPGFFDPLLLVAGVRREDGELEGILVNYGAHPVTLGPESLAVSSDYPGYLKDGVTAQSEADTAMFLLAGAGNINPRNCIQVGEEHPRGMGEALADLVILSLPRLRPVEAGPVDAKRVEWMLERDRDSYKRAGLIGLRKGDEIRTEISVFRAGALYIAMIPGEMFSEFNAKIRKMNPDGPTLVVTLANDCVGYLPTDEAQEQGAYETKMAPRSRLEADLVERVETAMSRGDS